MIHFLNRKELVTLVSQQTLFRVREALANANIPCQTRTHGAAGFAHNRAHGIPFIDQDAAYIYTIYVRREDYDRALVRIQPALREV